MSSTEATESKFERYSPSNWPLVGKLMAIGLLPALFITALGVLRVSDQIGAASDLAAANRLLQVRQQVAEAATALRDERDRGTLFVAGRRRGDRDPLNDAIGRTDAAVARAQAAIAGVDDIIDTPTRAALRQADGRFAQLSAIRTSVTGNALLLPGQVLQRYSFIVNRADGLDRAVVQQVQQAREPATVGLADALVAVTSASEAIELEHTVVGVSLIADAVTPDDRNAAAAADSTFIASYIQYEVALPKGVEPVNFVTADANSKRGAVRSAVLLGPTDGPIAVSPKEWDEASHGARDVVLAAEGQVTGALTQAGAAAERRSSDLAALNSAILLFGLVLTATVVAFVSRSLTGSLRLLRTSALDIAYKRLPQAVKNMRAGTGSDDVTVEPVPLRSRDEVGQVARAFDVVHGEAVRLAADQAALQSSVNSMFANLSLRSTSLVDRQLRLIEQLEGHEQDPDQLSNLFQLDHLATRMRRNSENLLVLAGTDTAKRSVAPAPLGEVLRTATSEVEQYRRVVVEVAPEVTVVGHVIGDVVHILAELIDNATNFSPPDTRVVMSSTRAADGSIRIAITDVGVGMRDDELTDANRRLSTPSSVDVATSRRMGLFVVGRLGTRHGIVVRLGGAPTDGSDDGLTASVTLPAHLVVADDDTAAVPTAEAGEAGGSRPRRTSADPVPQNAPPPPRVGRPGQPEPRVAPPARPEPTRPEPAQPVSRGLGSTNGLPTRTPGATLSRSSGTGEVGLPGSATPPVADEDAATGEQEIAPLFDPAADGGPAAAESDETAGERAGGAVAGSADPSADDAGQDGETDHGGGAGPLTDPFPAVADRPRSRSGPVDPSRSLSGEELFAARLPATADRGDPARRGQPARTLPAAERVDVDVATPIYLEVVSAWFAAQRSVPAVPEQDRRGGAVAVAAAEAFASRTPDSPSGPDRPDVRVAAAAHAGSSRSSTNGRRAAPGPAVPAARMARRPPAGRNGAQAVSAQVFATAADDGWRAANGAAVEPPDEVTAAGLPKRRPHTRLVPGSAGSAAQAPAVPPTRSAESVRDLLASHQQGVRQGREVQVRGESEDSR